MDTVESECLNEQDDVIIDKLNETPIMEDATDADTTTHGFNLSTNTTFIERQIESSPETDANVNKQVISCEGSDSGVEVLENVENCTLQRTLSTNSGNFQEYEPVTPARSCDSSIISCGSNYEEAYNLLVRRNSTLLDDYKLRNSDGTSEGGSESSSIVSNNKISTKRTPANVKKKVLLNDNKCRTPSNSNNANNNSSSRRTTPRASSIRNKSTDRLPPKTPTPNKITTTTKAPIKTRTVPDNLPLSNKKDIVKKTVLRTTSINRSPAATPSDDGRWPSINSRPAPLLAKNVRAEQKRIQHTNPNDSKSNALDKYATLPRSRKGRSAENVKETKKTSSRESSLGRLANFKKQKEIIQKTLPPYPKLKPKTTIYHETTVQTSLTIDDIERALNGLTISPSQPQDIDKYDKEIQTDRYLEELEKIREQYTNVKAELDEQKLLHAATEEKLKCEIMEKNGLKEELKQNSNRVLAILAHDDSISKDGKYFLLEINIL